MSMLLEIKAVIFVKVIFGCNINKAKDFILYISHTIILFEDIRSSICLIV